MNREGIKARLSFLEQNPRKTLLIILALALTLRVAAAFLLGNTVSGFSGAHDEISYSMLGQRFATGHGMTFPNNWYPWVEGDAPQSYYSYTVSLLLAGVYWIFGYQPIVARLLMAVMSTFVILMIYLIAKRFFDEGVALLTAAIAAVYAYLVFYGATLVTETPFTLLLLIAIYCGFKIIEQSNLKQSNLKWWLVLGAVLALTVLLRMAVVFFLPFFFIWLFLQLPNWRERAYALLPVIFIICAILPFTIRNYRLWDRFLLLEAQFGHVFWNGNHPDHAGDFHPYETFPIPESILASKNDAQITNELLILGVQNVLADPVHFGQLTLTRLREFFTFWPTYDSTPMANFLRVASFGILVPFAIIGLLLNLPRWRELAIIYLFIIIHTGIYAISWTMIRYRIPLDVFFIMFAASAVSTAYYAWRNRRPSSAHQLTS